MLKLVGILFLLSSCAAVSKYDKNYEASIVSPAPVFKCVELTKVYDSYYDSRGEVNVTEYTVETRRVQKQLNIIKSYFVPIVAQKCKTINKAEVEIKHITENHNKVWFAASTLTFGLIPSWEDYESVITVSIKGENSKLNKTYVSSFPYRTYISIFLWPVAFFNTSGTYELDQKTLPYHLNKLSKEANRDLEHLLTKKSK